MTNWEPVRVPAGTAKAVAKSASAAFIGAVRGSDRGDMGGVLMPEYISLATTDAVAPSVAVETERRVEWLAEAVRRPMLFGGSVGVGWVCAHIGARHSDVSDAEFEDFDNYLLQLVDGVWPFDYDLVSGLIGVGVYFRERGGEMGRRGVARVVATLDSIAEHQSADQVTWFSRPELLHPMARQATPEGCYNLGMAHGVPGVIAFLALVAAEGYSTQRCQDLVTAACSWLAAQERVSDPVEGFGSYVLPDGRIPRGRLAWCYGDLGVAISVALAGRTFRNAEWRDWAIRLGTRAGSRAYGSAGVVDAGLCHGASGVSHLFSRLRQYTGHPPFGDRAADWLMQAVAIADSQSGPLGPRAWTNLGGPRWEDDTRFLTGAAGVALAMNAALNLDEPAWDRCLLLS